MVVAVHCREKDELIELVLNTSNKQQQAAHEDPQQAAWTAEHPPARLFCEIPNHPDAAAPSAAFLRGVALCGMLLC